MSASQSVAAQASPVVEETTPFKFLDYFREEDEAKFAGRDGDVAEVIAGVARSPLFVLYGRSGVGKTSLLLAGVFPRLVERGFEPRRIRLGEDPVPDLARSFGASDAKDLPAALDRLCSEKPLVLAFDQFEELFVRFRERPEVRAQIGEVLASLLSASSRVRIVLGIREDYLAQLKDLAPSLGDVLGNAYRLTPPTAFGAHQAIVRPLDVAGVAYDESFVTVVLEELADCAYDPAVLQIACSEVYGSAAARAERPVHLTVADWKALGGSRGVFVRFLARVTLELGERAAMVRVALAEMITPEGNRRRVSAADIGRMLTKVPQDEIERLLAMLDERFRLVRRPDGKEKYELRHDRLVPAVREWLQSDPDFAHAQLARALVAQMAAWPEWRSSAEGLIQGPQLAAYVVPFGERIPLDAAGAELLLRSAVHAGDPSVRTWAKRLEAVAPGSTASVLTQLLDDPSASMRGNAAKAVQRIEHPGAGLLDRCLTLALEDDDHAVRAEAGRSVAHSGRLDVSRLEDALRDRSSRRKALGLLATLAHARRLPDALSRWRRAALRELRRRVHKDKRDVVWRRAYAASPATPASIAWSLLFAPLWLFVIAPAASPGEVLAKGLVNEDSVALVVSVGGFLAFLLALPVAVGSVFARSRSLVLREAALPSIGRSRSIALGVALRLPLLGFAGAAMAMVAATSGLGQAERGALLVVGVAGVVLAFLATPWISRWVRLCCPARSGRWGALLDALLWSSLCAGLAPFTAAFLVRIVAGGLGSSSGIVFAAAAGAVMASFAGFVTGIAHLSARFEAPLKSDAPAPPSRGARGAAIAAAALLVPVAAVAFGSSLPFMARRIVLERDRETVSLRPGFREVVYADFVVPDPTGSALTVVELTAKEGASVHVATSGGRRGEDERLRSGALGSVPLWVAFRGPALRVAFASRRRETISITRLAVPPGAELVAGSRNVLAAVTLRRDAGFAGSIEGALSGSAENERVLVRPVMAIGKEVVLLERSEGEDDHEAPITVGAGPAIVEGAEYASFERSTLPLVRRLAPGWWEVEAHGKRWKVSFRARPPRTETELTVLFAVRTRPLPLLK